MAVGGPESLYGNTDVFMGHRVSRDRRRYATQNDLVKHNRTETWFHDRSYTWAEIRDRHARCYPFPRGFYMFGHPHRCNLPYFSINGGSILPQFRSLKQVGSVRAAQGAPGSSTNRTWFTTIGISAPSIPASHTDNWVLVFTSGDFQGVERQIASFNYVTERMTLYNPASGMKHGKMLPLWDQRAIRSGDTFKIVCRHNSTSASQVTTLWETTSKIFRYPFGASPYNIYKSVRFKWSKVLGPAQTNAIGDDSTGVENWPINDLDRISLTWREVSYNFTPELAPVYPSDLFPGCGGKCHRLWPSEQHRGAIVSVTPVFMGNYKPPGRQGTYNVPVYTYDIVYVGTAPGAKRYEWPVFYRVKGGLPGFVPELWSQGRTKKCAPRPKRFAVRARHGGWFFTLVGDWIYCSPAYNGLPVVERNPLQYHADVYVRLRNMKDGGLTPLSRMKIGVKYRRISGYAWNIPVLEG